jgi:hypothetical protein
MANAAHTHGESARPTSFGPARIALYLVLLAFALVPISRSFNKTVSRLEGGLLLASYVGFLVLSAVRVGG